MTTLVFHNVADSMPEQRIRVLAFDDKGWCIGDCFYGDSYRQSRPTPCWRYTRSEDPVPDHIEIAQWCDLPSAPGVGEVSRG